MGFKATGGQDSGFQVHYASVDHIPREGDDSGVFLQYTEKVTPGHMSRNSYFKFHDQQSAWQQEMPRTAGVLLMGTGGSAPPHSTTYFEVQKLITSTCFTKPTLRFQKTLSFSHVQVSKVVYLSFLFYKTWTYCFLFQTACEIEDQREIHPFAFRTHTHRLIIVITKSKVII